MSNPFDRTPPSSRPMNNAVLHNPADDLRLEAPAALQSAPSALARRPELPVGSDPVRSSGASGPPIRLPEWDLLPPSPVLGPRKSR